MFKMLKQAFLAWLSIGVCLGQDRQVGSFSLRNWAGSFTRGPQYQRPLEAIRDIYRQAGIVPPADMRTTYEGLSETTKEDLRSGRLLAVTNGITLWLSPHLLKSASSGKSDDLIKARQLLFHEHEHMAGEHETKLHSLEGFGLPEKTQRAWMLNFIRRNEFEADQASYRKMTTPDLLRLLRTGDYTSRQGDDRHPSPHEISLMIQEELARRAGQPVPSEAAKSFFARNVPVTFD